MHRHIYRELQDWARSPNRKPLVLMGARQTGKTHALRWLGEECYENAVYLNFERDPLLASLFQGSLDPKQLIADISGYLGKPIAPGKTLLILDEIQGCNLALNALKYFCEEAPEIHVAAAGSLLGVKLSKGLSFPVGKVDFLRVTPMTFFEFLDASGQSHFRATIENVKDLKPIPEAVHYALLKHLLRYFIVGGMPEVVARFVASGDFDEARRVQDAILNAYRADFSKHAETSDIPKIALIWESLPSQLGRENKRFLYSTLKKGARGRAYETALRWLVEAGLVHFCHRVEKAALPLKAYASPDIFKAYCLDVGLLGALAGLAPEVLYRESRVFEEFHGAFVENFVAQHLDATRQALHYWESDGMAEVDFLCQTRDSLFPLEAKAGINVKSKSLRSFCDKYPEIRRICRTNLLNFQRAGEIENVPLYAIETLASAWK